MVLADSVSASTSFLEPVVNNDPLNPHLSGILLWEEFGGEFEVTGGLMHKQRVYMCQEHIVRDGRKLPKRYSLLFKAGIDQCIRFVRSFGGLLNYRQGFRSLRMQLL